MGKGFGVRFSLFEVLCASRDKAGGYELVASQSHVLNQRVAGLQEAPSSVLLAAGGLLEVSVRKA